MMLAELEAQREAANREQHVLPALVGEVEARPGASLLIIVREHRQKARVGAQLDAVRTLIPLRAGVALRRRAPRRGVGGARGEQRRAADHGAETEHWSPSPTRGGPRAS